MPTPDEWLEFLKPYCKIPHFTIREASVLLILHKQGSAGFHEIPQFLEIPPPSACRAIDRLCEQKFAKRSRPINTDQRKITISITEKGQQFAKGMICDTLQA